MAGGEFNEHTSMETTTVFELGYEDDRIVDLRGREFDPVLYSRFKYGDGQVVSLYADLIADDLIDNHGEKLEDGYVASSAYKHVPTAAHSISSRLISSLALHGHPPAGVFRIDRGVVRDNDYSSLTEEERLACTENNGLVLPELALRELTGKNALVIDDIKITGSHEKALEKVLGGAGLRGVLFSYVAVLDPEVAAAHPQTEHVINHAYVKGLQEVADIASGPDFMLNARTCKFILQASAGDVRQFVDSVPLYRAKHILSSMVSDGYHRMEKFEESFKVFSDAVTRASTPSPAPQNIELPPQRRVSKWRSRRSQPASTA